MGKVRARVLPWVVAALVVLVTTGCSGSARLGPNGMHAGEFIAAGTSSVDLVDVTTGQAQQVLMPTTRGRMHVNGLAVQDEMLYVTYSADERCTSGVAGCAPAEHSCGAEVDRFDLRTGSRDVVWRVDGDVFLADAVPNPDQTRIVARMSVCGHSYLNDHLVVRDLRSGTQVSLGAQLQRCHLLRDPSWTSNGAQLLVIYAPAQPAPAEGLPEGVCSEQGTPGLVALNADQDNPDLNGTAHLPPRGCGYESLAARAGHVYAVTTCGRTRQAVLRRLDQQLVPRQAWSLGASSDGSEIAIDTAGQVLVADYQSSTPQTVLDEVTGAHLTEVTTTPLGLLSPSHLAW